MLPERANPPAFPRHNSSPDLLQSARRPLRLDLRPYRRGLGYLQTHQMAQRKKKRTCSGKVKPLSTPKRARSGSRPPARGCEARATSGWSQSRGSTPKELRQSNICRTKIIPSELSSTLNTEH